MLTICTRVECGSLKGAISAASLKATRGQLECYCDTMRMSGCGEKAFERWKKICYPHTFACSRALERDELLMNEWLSP